MVRRLAGYGYMIRAYAIFQKVDTTGLGGHGAGPCFWSWLWAHLKPMKRYMCVPLQCVSIPLNPVPSESHLLDSSHWTWHHWIYRGGSKYLQNVFFWSLKIWQGTRGHLKTNIHCKNSGHINHSQLCRNLYPAAGSVSEVIDDWSQEQLFEEGELKSLARQV